MRVRTIALAAPLLVSVLAGRSASAQCAVSGPDSLCTGQTAELCGPDGAYFWLWTAPDGSDLPSTRCISVQQPGTYLLTLFDTVNGLSFACAHTVVAADCAPPPPPPPPPPAARLDCPRQAWWWCQQCAPSGKAPSALDSSSLEALLACAAERSGTVSASAVCAALERPQGRDARWRAQRQLMALRLNLCAYSSAVSDHRGAGLGIAATRAVVGLEGVVDGTTVGAWLMAADAEMLRLAGASLREKSVRRAYERIRRTALALNQGRGLASTCTSAMADGRGSEDDAAEGVEEEATGGLEVERLTPNPTAGATRVAWSLAQADEVEWTVVDIAGRTVRTLVRGWRPAGRHEHAWDGTGDDGRPLRSGAYFIRGRVGAERVEARLVLIR